MAAKTKKRRNLSAAQIRAGFGGKRRKAAQRRPAKKRRHAPATKKRRNAPKGGGRVITGYGSTVMNPRRKKRRNAGKKLVIINRARKRRAKARRRSNPGEILTFALGNPAKRRKTMAKAKRRRKATARRNPAGRSTRRKSTRRMSHRRRSNPGMIGNPKIWVKGGAGVLAGVLVARAVPQMFLAEKNQGAIGYLANAAAAAGAGFLAQMLFKDPVITASTVAGGFAALIARVISENTPYGKAISLTGLRGLGDYQFANLVGTVPQRIHNPLNASMEVGWDAALRPNYSLPSPAGAGFDTGRRGIDC